MIYRSKQSMMMFHQDIPAYRPWMKEMIKFSMYRTAASTRIFYNTSAVTLVVLNYSVVSVLPQENTAIMIGKS